MAANTLVDTFKALRDSSDWLNSMQIAHQTKRGERACREGAKALVEAGAARVKLVGPRQYFILIDDQDLLESLPFVVDIIETIKIKDKK